MFDIKKIILGVGIFLVFLLALGYGIEAFHESPKWEDYCGDRAHVDPLDREKSGVIDESYCLDNGGTWIAERGGYCDFDFECRQEFEGVRDTHNSIVFFVSIIVGLLAIVSGYFFIRAEPVGSALIASGIGAIFYGGIVNWENLSDVLRFILLLVVLVLLIWFAMRAGKK